MSGIKAALKAAKAALDMGNYGDVVNQANAVLASDQKNYFANIFLGRGLDKQGRTDDAVKAYESATEITPDDDQAWLGLRTLYEDQGHKRVTEYTDVSIRLAELYEGLDDKHRCQTAVDKLTSFVKENGTRAQYKRALEFLLPTSSVYNFLEGRIPHPSHTYQSLAEITETEEKERINREIGERRTRIGARVGQVTTEVKREIFTQSPLEEIYQSIIDWSDSDEIRREYEEKLLDRAYEALTVLPKDAKHEKRTQVLKYAHGMVIIKHPFKLAWRLELEWKDFESVNILDPGILREYISFFVTDGLAKVLNGYLSSHISPFPSNLQEDGQSDGDQNEETKTTMNAEERLLVMTEGIQDADDSALAHRLMSDYYFHIEEYQIAADTARNGLELLKVEANKSGLTLQENIDAINGTLAASLVYHEAPKNHPEARSIFDAILTRKPTYTPALLGIGLILIEEEEFVEAVNFLGRALKLDPINTSVAAELAWCKTRVGELEKGMNEMQNLLPQMKTDDPRSRDRKALTYYRVGRCLWHLNPSKSARKDRKGTYAQFMAALRINVNFAPAYTGLGLYYEMMNDKKRARQCFQRAFELSASSLRSGEYVACSFAEQGDWDIVEVVAQRAIGSGKIRVSPGSKRPPVSWPYSALGVVQMSRQEYSKSVASFLTALRIKPDDYDSYVGLGESYHNSGRYNSASKTFHYAEAMAEKSGTKMINERWFTQYMLANVNRELGAYEDAIDGYRGVLNLREKEFGVLIALLQTYNELSWHYIELGFFGQAAKNAKEAIHVAELVASDRPDAFNLWKSLGDACSIFTLVQDQVEETPIREVRQLLETGMAPSEYNTFADVDGIGHDQLMNLAQVGDRTHLSWLTKCLHAAILAQKRAIHASSHDVHAQAVAWYNLGWTEYRGHTSLEATIEPETGKPATKYLKAAMRCFKRAIELEAGNAEFWNALGVVTSLLNPKVAQHSFVRSLHLNERSARTWTNLGTLYLLQSDLELAHTAFARAQSTDPDYAHAWIGEGLLALLWGDSSEGLAHFTHAFEISDSSCLIAKRQYATSAFDNLLSAPMEHNRIATLIQPLFALQQLEVQSPRELPYKHLSALYFERVGRFASAIDALSSVCSAAELEYEESESPKALGRYSQAKSDLARNQLAARDFASAAKNAETALDLSLEADSSALHPEYRRKLRLSAHLTAGLANCYSNNADKAIEMFRSALEESHSAADVVCTLAEVLWAKGGEEEKTVAREQLFDCVEMNLEHVGSRLLLGAIATFDEDEAVMEAASEDLQSIRTLTGLDTNQQRRIEDVLAAICLMLGRANALDDGMNDKARWEFATSIMLFPSQPHGWSELAATSGEPYPAQMVLKTATRAVPPHGPLDSEDLAKAYAGAATIGDAQRAIMLSPWIQHGWEAFRSVLE